MKYINKLLGVVATSIFLISCADLDYESDFATEKSEDVINMEFLNSYNLLNTYNSKSDFKLGINIASADFLGKKTPYSLAITNFDEVSISDNAMTHAAIVGDDGSMSFLNVKSLIQQSIDSKISLFGGPLSWYAQQNDTYLFNSIADIPGEMKRALLVDFESDALGTNYPMSGNSTATVVTDPKGISGNVLLVGNLTEKANQSFPQINIQLPEGLTLRDCRKVVIDLNAQGSTGLYGGGMKMTINNHDLVVYGSPASFGCPDGNWGRNSIQLEIAKFDLTASEKDLTNFVLTVGSGTGSGYYYMDNITIEYEYGAVVRTPEERAEIIENKFDTWTSGIMEASAGAIKSWDLIREPMSDKADQMLKSFNSEGDKTKLFLVDVLGDNYVRSLAKYARKYYSEWGGTESLKLFVSESELLDMSNNKCERLIQMIKQWEADGTTKIDGIGANLNLNYSLDATTQVQNKANLVKLFTMLGATNKYIRISGLELKVVDTDGQTINPSALSSQQLQAVSEYYKEIISQYYALIPDGKHYGITISPIQSSTNVGLWSTGYNRKYTYSGFTDGLSNK